MTKLARIVIVITINIAFLTALTVFVRLIWRKPLTSKPYVKQSKNDAADAKTTREAVTRPTMRFMTASSGRG